MSPTNLFKTARFLALASVAALIGSCSKNDAPEVPDTAIIYGKYVNVGKGQARSYLIMDKSGLLKEIGFNFNEAALEGLPAINTPFVLPMPEGNISIINHISFDFTVHGHGPEHIYDVAHFDVHYYMIPEAEKNSITITDPKIDVVPPLESIPKHYIPGANEPKMGKHWADSTAHEFHGMDFTSTFIYGSYNGKFIFMEPMIALSYLKKKPTVSLPVTPIGKIQQAGHYPQKYSITWNESTKLFAVSLNDLTLRTQ